MAYAIIDGRSSMSNLSKAQSLTSCHVVVIQANVIFGHVTMMTVYWFITSPICSAALSSYLTRYGLLVCIDCVSVCIVTKMSI